MAGQRAQRVNAGLLRDGTPDRTGDFLFRGLMAGVQGLVSGVQNSRARKERAEVRKAEEADRAAQRAENQRRWEAQFGLQQDKFRADQLNDERRLQLGLQGKIDAAQAQVNQQIDQSAYASTILKEMEAIKASPLPDALKQAALQSRQEALRGTNAGSVAAAAIKGGTGALGLARAHEIMKSSAEAAGKQLEFYRKEAMKLPLQERNRLLPKIKAKQDEVNETLIKAEGLGVEAKFAAGLQKQIDAEQENLAAEARKQDNLASEKNLVVESTQTILRNMGVDVPEAVDLLPVVEQAYARYPGKSATAQKLREDFTLDMFANERVVTRVEREAAKEIRAGAGEVRADKRVEQGERRLKLAENADQRAEAQLEISTGRYEIAQQRFALAKEKYEDDKKLAPVKMEMQKARLEMAQERLELARRSSDRADNIAPIKIAIAESNLEISRERLKLAKTRAERDELLKDITIRNAEIRDEAAAMAQAREARAASRFEADKRDALVDNARVALEQAWSSWSPQAEALLREGGLGDDEVQTLMAQSTMDGDILSRSLSSFDNDELEAVLATTKNPMIRVHIAREMSLREVR